MAFGLDQADWFNRNEYTASMGGPIVKNKTFLFGLWEQQFENRRRNGTPGLLTDCARNGIFRYYDNWADGNFNTQTSPSRHNPR